MTKIKKGILGGLSGKIGPVVGANWKGTDYLRSKPSIPPVQTPPRKMAQAKFGYLTSFLKPFHPYLLQGFKHAAIGKTEFNAAFTANFKTALQGEYPDFSIDFSQLLLSSGKLEVVANPTCTRLSASKLQFKWQDVTKGHFHIDDLIMIVVYSAKRKRADGMIGGVKRNAGNCIFKMEKRLWTSEVEVFISVIGHNGRAVSNSYYLGKVDVI
ncbi:DUF6266 family protein [Pedobacter frigidisoli]|uniref:DUF6266 family protein n=1 Tax=Pedobacter frigidisoli TaxID=2530455 RepID=UPI00292E0CE4|nr:DUF6266 family protein [Pedobacter frigidisoli]